MKEGAPCFLIVLRRMRYASNMSGCEERAKTKEKRSGIIPMRLTVLDCQLLRVT